MKFDCIIGNPPYQPRNKGDRGQWALFIRLGDDLLEAGGVMAMIVPHGWKSPTADVRKGGIRIFADVLSHMDVIELNMDPGMGKRHFPGIGHVFTWFMVRNAPAGDHAEICLGDHSVMADLRGMKMLPKTIDPISMSIVRKLTSKGDAWNFKFRRSIMNAEEWEDAEFEESATHPHPRINGNSNHLDRIVWTREPCEMRELRKICIPKEGTNYEFVVDDGELGVSDGYVAILDDNACIEAAKAYFGSRLIRWHCMNKFTQYNEAALINCVGAMPLEKGLAEEDVFRYYNLTDEEMEYVNGFGGSGI